MAVITGGQGWACWERGGAAPRAAMAERHEQSADRWSWQGEAASTLRHGALAVVCRVECPAGAPGCGGGLGSELPVA